MATSRTIERPGPGKRVTVSVTVAPDLLAEVDRYAASHPGTDRSKVFDEALWLWYAREQERQMEEQFAEPEPPEVQAELASWRQIQRAAAERLFSRHPDD